MLLTGNISKYFKFLSKIRPEEDCSNVYLMKVLINPFKISLPDKVCIKMYNMETRFTCDVDMAPIITQHDGTIKYYGHCIFSDSLKPIFKQQITVWEYVEGQDLYQCIKDDNYYGVDMLKITKSLFNIVLHFHSKGVYHRDIKPENVMLLKSGNIRIIDYDVSCNYATNTGNFNLFAGSKQYYCVNTINGKYDTLTTKQVFRINDLWAAAITIATMYLSDNPQDRVDSIHDIDTIVNKVKKISIVPVRELLLSIIEPSEPNIQRLTDILSSM